MIRYKKVISLMLSVVMAVTMFSGGMLNAEIIEPENDNKNLPQETIMEEFLNDETETVDAEVSETVPIETSAIKVETENIKPAAPQNLLLILKTDTTISLKWDSVISDGTNN